MNVAQIEYANSYSDPLPAADTVSRMGKLCVERDKQIERVERRQSVVNAVNRLHLVAATDVNNELTQARLRLREIQQEIVEVARLIVAEANNAELQGVATCN